MGFSSLVHSSRLETESRFLIRMVTHERLQYRSVGPAEISAYPSEFDWQENIEVNLEVISQMDKSPLRRPTVKLRKELTDGVEYEKKNISPPIIASPS